MSSFNSAPALTPGMTSGMSISYKGTSNTLPFRPGTDAVDDALTTTLRRRCPARFNSATALTPWMTAAGVVARRTDGELQFGHGTDAVDDVVDGVPDLHRREASIRPRH